MSDWVKAKNLFAAWPEPVSDQEDRGTIARLTDALTAVKQGATGWRDIASLTRQVLLEAAVGGNTLPLTVPIDPSFPTLGQWREVGCQGHLTEPGVLTVSAQSWHPNVPAGWAEQAATADLKEIHRGLESDQRRHLDSVPGDPFWAAALGYDSYYSIGQRQAARTVVMAPPGSTTIVCLPTGHGKTPVALAPTLLGDNSSGVSLVIVPTVVLALDMERRTRELLSQRKRRSPSGRYAYTGDLPEDIKHQISEDVRQGRQPVLFTSPEAVTTSLQKSLDDAAEAGQLRYVIIDEAHLVEQWGNEFRPAFQVIAGQRRNWIRRAPQGYEPRTIAMSATLTAQQVETLENLFGSRDATEIVWASQLRSEPSYYIDTFADEESRRHAVLQALTRLPKPAVLYVSRVEDANSWVAFLRNTGFFRVTAVTGRSDQEARRVALEGWSGRSSDGVIPTQFDIVVGTSAFGLGVDLSDVKTIVHACVPETIDRYYQEVGRGGRDGSPSIAYMAINPGLDLPIAEHLNRQSIITPELAWKRWNSMFQQRVSDTPSGYLLSLDSLPPHLSEGFERNRQWNVRTLNLMVLAKLIELKAPDSPTPRDGESQAEWQERLHVYYETLDSRITANLIDKTNNPKHFTDALKSTRTKILGAQIAALDQLKLTINGKQCIADLLADYYVLKRPIGALITSKACRGCPYCRQHRPPPPPGELYVTPWQPHPDVIAWKQKHNDPLAQYRSNGNGSISIWWETEEERRSLVPELIESLCRRGITTVGGPGINMNIARRIQKRASPYPLVLDNDEDMLTSYSGPVVWVLDDTRAELSNAERWRFDSADITYLIHNRSLRHPDKPSNRLDELHSDSISITRALRSL